MGSLLLARALAAIMARQRDLADRRPFHIVIVRPEAKTDQGLGRSEQGPSRFRSRNCVATVTEPANLRASVSRVAITAGPKFCASSNR
jgi:hypothetical protein